MKTIKLLVIVALLFTFAAPVFAIEGLQLSIQSSNAILSWPSSQTNGETFIVQYRQTLSATDSWQTLTDDLAAATDTNLTFFTNFNNVQYPAVGDDGTNGGGDISPMDLSDEPMAKPANGSGDATPLALYPPGFDLSGFNIFDPATGDWVSGDGYSVKSSSADGSQGGGLQPMDDSGDSTNQYTGFYRVVRDGVHVYGLTNGMVLSGVVQFPIEMALDYTDQIVGVSFYDTNNDPILGAYAPSSSSNVWQMVWDTPMSFNGDYTIYAELDFASNDPMFSSPVTVTVSNIISFPNNFSQTFGNQMWIYAETIPDAAYQIDMYDENTNYLGSFTGSADDSGVISFLWDLTDGNGDLSDSTNFTGAFTVDTSSLSDMSQSALPNNSASNSPKFQTVSLAHKTLVSEFSPNGASPDGSSPSANAQNFWVKEPKWTPNNNWVVAYGLFSGNAALQTADVNMLTGGPGGEYGGVLGTLDQYGLNGNLSPGNSAQNGTVFTLQDQASRTNLLGYLADHRYENFYFFGHGNKSAIGAYNGYILTYNQIANALLNIPLSYKITHAAEHPYRFVVLDGCDTGAGILSEAFAIPAMTVSTNFFAGAGVESRAFLGYKSWKVDNITQFNWENYSGMTSSFLGNWLSGQVNLETCVYDAQNNIPQTGAQMDSSAVIYGAADMFSNTHTGQ
ncbi:MAG: hypothetical protein ACREFE_04865 [Limisphaerales bacterium]